MEGGDCLTLGLSPGCSRGALEGQQAFQSVGTDVLCHILENWCLVYWLDSRSVKEMTCLGVLRISDVEPWNEVDQILECRDSLKCCLREAWPSTIDHTTMSTPLKQACYLTVKCTCWDIVRFTWIPWVWIIIHNYFLSIDMIISPSYFTGEAGIWVHFPFDLGLLGLEHF